MPSEFNLIARFFTRPTPSVTLGIGDDCALITPQAHTQIAISCDMLVSGVHFFSDTDPKQLGHKSLAVNLSDLAAMGAKPLAFTLALSLPEANEAWLKPFSDGLFELAEQFDCPLIGGDTTRGPLNICITVFGELPKNIALRRDHAKPGDDIWVSGSIGDARAALEFLQSKVSLDSEYLDFAISRLQKPTPRVELGMAIRQYAHAALDLSDGLLGDISHILNRSKVGATINVDALPKGKILYDQTREFQMLCMLAGGDDYELCFTASPSNREAILKAASEANTPVTIIGQIEEASGLRLINSKGQTENFSNKSFDHFLNK